MLKKLFLLALIAIVFLLVSCGGDKKVLHMYTAFDTEEAKFYIEAFEKETGIDVEYVRLSAGELAARVEAEKANPQSSVWFAGPNTSHIAAAGKGLLSPYKPKTDFVLKDQLHAKDWTWSGFYTGAIGFVTNKDFLKEKGIEAPTSWADLLKPEFKKNVAAAYPYTSGTAYTILATLVQKDGLDNALNYWKKLDENSMHQYTKSGSACVTMTGQGEIAVGISFSHDIINKGINKGYPVVISFPKEGTGYEVGAVSLIKGGPEPELGKEFIDWVFSTNCQNLFKNKSRLPINPKAEVAKGAVTLEMVNLIDYDAIWAGQNKEKVIKAWRDKIGK